MSSFTYPPLNAGHRERLRERFYHGYFEGMHDYEVLELLLTFVIARKDVKPIAKNVIRHFGSLRNALDATIDELCEVPDIGKASATLIKVAKEINTVYWMRAMFEERDVMKNPESVIKFAGMKIGGLSNEVFMLISVNVRHEVVAYDIINEGTLDQVAVYPRRILEKAIQRKAAGLILIHNHPSGHLEPSEDDRELTRRIQAALRSVEIRLLDHLIVSRNGHVSFATEGWI